MPFLGVFYLKERILLLQSAIHEHCTESIFIENIKSWWERRGLGAEALPELRAQGDEWAVRQERKSRNLADTGIKRACVAVRRTHIRQNCLKKLCPWTCCPFFFTSLCLYTLLFIFFSLFPLFRSQPQMLPLHFWLFLSLFSLFFPSPPCSSTLHCLCMCVLCMWLPTCQAFCEITVSMLMRASEHPVLVHLCVCVFKFALEA